MSRELLQPAVNVIRGETSEWMENFCQTQVTPLITPAHLDVLEGRLHKKVTERFPALRIRKELVREEVVSTILSEYGTDMFGVAPTVKKNVISDKAIKKYSHKK